MEPFTQADQFEKSAVELNDVIFRAPGMAIARADLEAEATIDFGLGGQIARGDDEMIYGARHKELPWRNATRPRRYGSVTI